MAERKLVLNVWERLALINCVGLMQGNVAQVRAAFQILEMLEFKPEEKERLSLVQQNGSYSWNSAVDIETPMNMSDEQHAMAGLAVMNFQTWLAGDFPRLKALCDKLGVSYGG